MKIDDKPIEERVNEGEDFSTFMPAPGDRDMVTVRKQSQTRRQVYGDEQGRSPWATQDRRSTDIQRQWGAATQVPNYVISVPVQVDGRRWTYETRTTGVAVRRVFTYDKEQERLTLDIDETLTWQSAGPGSPLHDELRNKLEREADYDNTNNQLVLQLMWRRHQQGTPLIDSRYRYKIRNIIDNSEQI